MASVENALASGWRIFKQDAKWLAEKSVSLPGATATLIREEHEDFNTLLGKVEVRESLLGGDPSQPVKSVVTNDGTSVTDGQHEALKVSGVAVPGAETAQADSEVAAEEAAVEDPPSEAESVAPVGAAGSTQEEQPATPGSEGATADTQPPEGEHFTGSSPTETAPNEGPDNGVSGGAEQSETAEPVEGVVVERGDFVVAPGAGETEPVPTTEDLKPEDVAVVSGGAVASEGVADTESVKPDADTADPTAQVTPAAAPPVVTSE